jgi:hypothetical protein
MVCAEGSSSVQHSFRGHSGTLAQLSLLWPGRVCLGDIDVDSLDQVKKLREDYERALDAAESHRVAYHEAVLNLYRSGTPLREIAKELGLSHQRVHQIVSGEPPRRRSLGRAAGGIAGVLVLTAATFGALRIAHAPPFDQTVRVRPVKYHAIVMDPATGRAVSRRLVPRR